MYTIALNCLSDHGRRGRAERRALTRFAPPAEDEGPDELGQVEERDRLMRALARLTKREREAVALRYGADLSVGEVAAATGARKGAIDGRLHRALAKLRTELE